MIKFNGCLRIEFKSNTPSVDVRRVIPQLAGTERVAVRLHPIPCSDVPVEESKIGGTFLWPKDEPWPLSDEHQVPLCSISDAGFKEVDVLNREFVPVMQLTKAEVPELLWPDDCNIFQLLWNPRSYEKYRYAPDIKVYWRKATDIRNVLDRVPKASSPDPCYVPSPCAVRPERVIEYPSIYEIPDKIHKCIEQVDAKAGRPFYQFELSTAPGIKVGGYAPWLQYEEIPICSCGKKMEYVLSFDSCEFDGGSAPRWKPTVVNSILPIEPENDPTGLQLGRDGILYVFVCRLCDPWQIQWVLQSQ